MSSSPVWISFRELDELLRARGRFARDATTVPWRALLGVGLASAACAGAMLGARGGIGPQMLLSAVKVPILIGASTLLALPSLFVIHCVVGLRSDFPAVLRGILSSQAAVALAFAALGPLLLLLYSSSDDYRIAKTSSGVLFLVASLAGQRLLSVHYGPLARADRRHRMCRRLWWFLQALITIQLAWLMRPFIGSPDLPLEFFRAEAWGNAYVELARMLRILILER